jgi:hypothetical protein
MDIRRALIYLFQDPHGVGTLGLAMVLNILPVTLGNLSSLSRLGLFVLPPPLAALVNSPFWYIATGLLAVPLSGYMLRVTRQVVAGQELPLPAWSDVSGILRDGLLVWGLVSLWDLPLQILQDLSGLSSRSTGDRGPSALAQLLLVLVLIVIGVIMPAAEARLATTGSFMAGMDIGAAVRTVRSNIGGYVLLMLVTAGGGLIVIGLAMGLVVLITILTSHPLGLSQTVTLGILLLGLTLGAYTGFVLAHLSGQVYAQARRRLGMDQVAPLVGGTPAD